MSAAKLRNLRLRRVSLVDEPASQDREKQFGSFVVLFKSADMVTCKACGYAMEKGSAKCEKCGAEMKAASAAEDTTMTTEEINALKAAAKTATDAEAKAKADAAELQKKLDAANAAAATNADLQKRLTEAEASAKASADAAKTATEAVEKLQVEREVADFTKRAEKLDKLAIGTPAEFGAILRKISKALTADEMAKLEKGLAAANAAAAGAFTEIGHTGGDQPTPGSATAELETKAAALVKESSGKLSLTEAQRQVCKSDPALYQRVRAEGFAAGNGAN